MVDIDIPGLNPGEAEELAEMVAMGIKLNTDDFRFTCYADETVLAKIDFTIFHRLNEQLSLEDFGKGIRAVGFAFIAQHPKFFLQDQHIKYIPSYHRISISLELDYDTFVAATPEEAIDMMKQLYLTGLRVLPLFNIKDFDTARFIEAVEEALNQ